MNERKFAAIGIITLTPNTNLAIDFLHQKQPIPKFGPIFNSTIHQKYKHNVYMEWISIKVALPVKLRYMKKLENDAFRTYR